MKNVKEKPECADCVYSEYDYLGGDDAVFIGCFGKGKCKGCVKPKKQDFEFDIDGKKFHVHQGQWLSFFDGVTQNLCVYEEMDGKMVESLHAGHCGKFLTEDEARELCETIYKEIFKALEEKK